MQQKDIAEKFADYWNGRGNEDAHKQIFWLDLLRKIFDIDDSGNFIQFEMPVSFGGSTHKIDAYIPKTKVLIEQKSFPTDLSSKLLQSDGKFLTPFEQALRYAEHMEIFPRWIVTCNFAEFHIYYFGNILSYLEPPAPVIIKLEDLPDDYERLNFLVNPNDTTILDDVNISKKALNIIKKIRDDFEKVYIENHVADYDDFLYKICVRLVFCFYADDSRLFDANKYFATYLRKFTGNAQIEALQKVFDVLATPYNLRENFDDALKKFPYVNGGLFEEKISLPNMSAYFTTTLDTAFFDNRNFHWEKINPTIFGAMFESALSPKLRRTGGMHYTSTENIHKVIAPLFLDDLHKEFKSAKGARKKNRLKNLRQFQNKLASLTFFDPACGSGNFLTETYISIRKLENETIRAIQDIIGKNLFDDEPIKVSIENFFGIEIHPYAVAVAKVALWIAEHQMLHKTEKILHRDLKPLPLKNYPNIICANALNVDWEKIIPRDKLNFIISNPPFVGRRYRTKEQTAEIAKFFTYKDVDYVACWYKKAADFIQGTKIQCAFVSTNSITQGEQVAAIWKNLPVKINFAYRTFKWQSESESMAAVHCVIIDFAQFSRRKKFIFDGNKIIPAQNINAYLLDAPNIYIEHRTKPICDVPEMCNGNVPLDGDALKIEEYDYYDFIKREPPAKKFIKKLIGGRELLYNEKRYVLWLADCSEDELNKMPLALERVNRCKENRLSMKDKSTRKLANTPATFRDTFNPDKYIALPIVSSENRKYIPMNYFDGSTIPTNQVQIIPGATLYHFGILTSSVHMIWMKTVCGRLEMRYRYSKDIVYNNFVWCEPTDEQKKLIEATAQKILDVRKKFADKNLAYLYNELTMPKELRDAHKKNDSAVMAAYGFAENMSEGEIVAALMKLYKNLT